MLPEIDPTDIFPPMTPYQLMKFGRAVLLPYFRPGDPGIADAVNSLGGVYAAVLLANHGPIVAGDTLQEAGNAIEEMEQTAKLYLLLRNQNPVCLTQQQIAELHLTQET